MLNSVYPHASADSEYIFKNSILFNKCFGIHDKKNNELASWCLHGTFGSLFSLQTVDKYKRRGLAKLIVKILMKKLVAEEPKYDTTAFVILNNVASENLFNSLGFKNYGFLNVTFTNYNS